jgi:anaerobic selenocysteine-containing dehydrogenase
LFERITGSPSGALISVHEYDDTFAFIRHPDGKIHLAVHSMLDQLEDLRREGESRRQVDPDYPFLLSAGERRSSNALSNYRDPEWRKTDGDGHLRIHPADAARLGIGNGDGVVCESARGSVTALALIDDSMLPGALSLPHGFGLAYTGDDGRRRAHGPLVNELTALAHCDPLTKTPYHKNVPVRIRRE